MEAKHVLAAALVLGGGAAAVWALRQQRRGDSAPQPVLLRPLNLRSSCADELPRIRQERAQIWEEAAAVATGYSPSALYYDEATATVRHVNDGRIVVNLPYWGLTRYIRGEVEKIWGCVNGACTTDYDLMSKYEPYRQRYLDTLRRERLCR